MGYNLEGSAPVAQWIERLSANREVVGPNPAGGTIDPTMSAHSAERKPWHDEIVQRKAEYTQGPKASSNFERAMRGLFRISKSETPERPKREKRRKKAAKNTS
jgi:hypothetical protein